MRRAENVVLGTMIEVPSLLLQLDELFRVVDFASVGSNDLMQFVMASDRGEHAARRTLRSAEPGVPARAPHDRRARPTPPASR